MQSEKPRVLGIEGGGTKTEWALVADGVLLDRGVLAASNLKLTSDETLANLFSVMPGEVTHVGAFLAELKSSLDEADTDSTSLKLLLAKMLPEYKPFLPTPPPRRLPEVAPAPQPSLVRRGTFGPALRAI